MKKYILLVLACVLFNFLGFSQHKGLIVEKYGGTYKVEDSQFEFDREKEHKVIFDIFTDTEDFSKMNEKLVDVAEYLNMYVDNGVPLENLKVIVVLHGSAARNVLTNSAYKRLFNTDNPNEELIKAMSKVDVDLIVSDDAFTKNSFSKDDKLPFIKVSPSAQTALVWYQTAGYEIVNFN